MILMNLKFLSFVLSLGLGSVALAQSGTTGVSTASTITVFPTYFHLVTAPSANERTVYAGRTVTGCTSTSQTTPCDSCAQLAAQPISSYSANQLVCNRQEIHPDLYFTVGLSHTNAATYISCPDGLIGMKVSGDTGSLQRPIAGTQTSYTDGVAGQSVSASFKWSQICSLIGAGTDCTQSSDGSKVIEIGFNSGCNNSALVDVGVRMIVNFRYVTGNLGFMTFPCSDSLLPLAYEGICSFSVFRGDEKVYFENIGAPKHPNLTTLPVADSSGTAGVSRDSSNISYDKLRVFCKPVSGAQYSTLTTNDVCGDLQIDGKTLTKAKIEGLMNGVQYEFLAANVDQAGNVTYFSDPSAVGPLGLATPEPVNGLLDGKGCFIATAAFGSSMAPEVEKFRQFRDQVLMKYDWGRAFVEFYYEHSPEAARFIANNEILRIVTRFLLYPILFLAELVTRFGFLAPILGGFLIFGFFRAQRRMKREKA